jgi:nucleotide-binding universal stress UspA family protein
MHATTLTPRAPARLTSPHLPASDAEASAALLVATDGTAASDSAVRVAAAIAERRGVVPAVVSALEPILLTSGPDTPMAFVPTGQVEMARESARLDAIASQLGERTGSGRWPVSVVPGDPAAVIADGARREGAGLIVMGLHQHSVLERLVRDETTLRVMRRAAVPVLAATNGLAELPRGIVAAVDFSRASLRAARLALSLLGEGGTLWLACVEAARRTRSQADEARHAVFEDGVRAAFARLVRELEPPRGATVEPVLLEGDPAPELLAFAARKGADLIAIGSHRRSLIDRVLLGSVTSSVVRAGRVSVLVTPPE